MSKRTEISGDGVILVAHGKASYWDEAATLTRSLRARSPGVAIAIASDFEIPESVWRAAGYDAFLPFSFKDCGGVSFKMHLDRISPFAGRSLFLDSDSICYGDIGGVFDAFHGDDFVTFGRMLTECHWFEDASRIRREFGCREFPFFCGDFYLFRRSQKTLSIFEAARDIASRFKSLGIHPLGGWCNDEPAFSLAMVKNGVHVKTREGQWILTLAHAGLAKLRLNYATATATANLDGVGISPRVIHFAAHRSRPIYFRERHRVYHPKSGRFSDCVALGVGITNSLAYRTRRRFMP